MEGAWCAGGPCSPGGRVARTLRSHSSPGLHVRGRARVMASSQPSDPAHGNAGGEHGEPVRGIGRALTFPSSQHWVGWENTGDDRETMALLQRKAPKWGERSSRGLFPPFRCAFGDMGKGSSVRSQLVPAGTKAVCPSHQHPVASHWGFELGPDGSTHAAALATP